MFHHRALPAGYSLPGEARKSLGDSGKGEIAEVLNSPKAFPAAVNATSDDFGDAWIGVPAWKDLPCGKYSGRKPVCQVLLQKNLTVLGILKIGP